MSGFLARWWSRFGLGRSAAAFGYGPTAGAPPGAVVPVPIVCLSITPMDDAVLSVVPMDDAAVGVVPMDDAVISLVVPDC